MIDASRQPETYEYLKQLKEHWERLSPNPLSIPQADEFESPESSSPPPESPEPSKSTVTTKVTSNPAPTTTINRSQASSSGGKSSLKSRNSRPFGGIRNVLTSTPTEDPPGSRSSPGSLPPENLPSDGLPSDQSDSDAPPMNKLANKNSARAAVAPIKIFVDDHGNLVLQSDDTAALDRLEELMQTRRPPRRDYDIFHVKHLTATWISIDLEKYFKDRAEKKENSNDRFLSWYYGIPPSSSGKTENRQFGKRPPISFIANNDSNTIIVRNADDADRQTIKDLIELWDVPEPVNTKNVRVFAMVRIQHSRAETIVEAIKDVYRDLLSTNDKAFQQANARPNPDGSRGDSGYRRSYSDDVVSPTGGLNFTFKGKLSLGVEPTTNSILVSADGDALLELVRKMINELDIAAKTEGHTVVRQLGHNVDSSALGKALRSMLEPKKQQPGQMQNQQRQPGVNPPNAPNGNPAANFGGEAPQ